MINAGETAYNKLVEVMFDLTDKKISLEEMLNTWVSFNSYMIAATYSHLEIDDFEVFKKSFLEKMTIALENPHSEVHS